MNRHWCIFRRMVQSKMRVVAYCRLILRTSISVVVFWIQAVFRKRFALLFVQVITNHSIYKYHLITNKHPELLCSLLFTERMDLNECLIIMGCERFNSYTGYASSFKWNGTYVDHTPMDAYRRKMCSIVAIDATYFHEQSHQYEEELIKRELNKVRSTWNLGFWHISIVFMSFQAFVGFYHELNTPAPAVATGKRWLSGKLRMIGSSNENYLGNWGCGAFNGDKSLKSLLQLMVCCVTNRPLVYFTFGDKQLRDDFYTIYQYLTRNKVKIGKFADRMLY